jgi:hypothetical protein
MIFEGGGLKITVPLHPMEERRYVDLMRKEINKL